MTRKADLQRLGIMSAKSQLDLAWFQATRDTPDEAKFAYDLHLVRVAGRQ